MKQPESIYSLITQHDDQHLTVDEVADRVMADCRDNWMTILRPLVADAIRDHRRAIARNEERAAYLKWSPRSKRTGKVIGYVTPASSLGFAFTAHFRGVGGRLVTWGEATVEDHEARIAEQEKRIDGLMIDVKNHRRAIDTIQSHPGAKCLNDVLKASV